MSNIPYQDFARKGQVSGILTVPWNGQVKVKGACRGSPRSLLLSVCKTEKLLAVCKTERLLSICKTERLCTIRTTRFHSRSLSRARSPFPSGGCSGR